MSRSFLIGPVICTLVGVGVGVCLGMICHQDAEQRARVYIGDSLPLASWGAFVGIIIGGCVFALVRHFPHLLPTVTIVMTTGLGAVVVAPIGWMLGDISVRQARPGMLIGAIIGTTGGFLVGVAQNLQERRKLAETSAASARGGRVM